MGASGHEESLTWEDSGDLEADFEHGVEPRVGKRRLSHQPLPTPFSSKTLAHTFFAVKVEMEKLSTPSKSSHLGS